MATQERRGGLRIDTRWPCRLHHPEAGFLHAEASNLSLRDVLFITERKMAVGDSIQFELEYKPSEWIHGIARVSREEPASRNRWSYAVRIVRLSGDGEEVLRAHLASISDLYRVKVDDQPAAA